MLVDQDIIRQLESFVIDNSQLEQLENLIAEFNIFEAMGAVRQELRHSDFLAFLLNPAEKHGLGDLFLKRFLIRVVSDADEAPISPITIELANFSESVVERETQNIDILIHDARNSIVCIIENKIDSAEHDDQLNRYLQIAHHRFPSAKAIIPIFLTRDGEPPADENSIYIPLSYGQVADIIDHVRKSRESLLGADIHTMIRHYVMMLRRHIVSDSDIAQLCQQIYRQHKVAIDLIVEHIPDMRLGLANYLMDYVRNSDGILIYTTKTYMNFAVLDWEAIPELNVGTGWSKKNTVVAFEFVNLSDRLDLRLLLGPTKPEHNYIRDVVLNHAQQATEIFRGCRPHLSKKWTILFKISLLRKTDYQDASLDDLIQIIEPKLQRFFDDILPQINQHLLQVRF